MGSRRHAINGMLNASPAPPRQIRRFILQRHFRIRAGEPAFVVAAAGGGLAVASLAGPGQPVSRVLAGQQLGRQQASHLRRSEEDQAAASYAALPAAEAKRLAARRDIHYTLKHGSRLNIAELEPNVLQRQCLNRRLGDRATMDREVTVWADRRNRAGATVAWQFTTTDVRTKRRRLYATFDA